MSFKSFVKRLVLRVLERLVRWRLHKIQPQIIGVTGSVGKTSTKEAIYAVVSSHQTAYRNKKSYNTEFGLLLSILEEETGYSNPLKWLRILFNSFLETWNLKYAPYQTLIVEMGANKPGDIGYLANLIRPTIGVLTNVKPVHMGDGQFSNLESIFIEKSKLVKSLPREGWAILNCDDPNIIRLEHELPCNTILYGTSPKADLRAHDIKSCNDGLKFILSYEKKTIPLHFPNLLGRHHVYVLLPAIAVGFLIGMPLRAIVEALHPFKLPPGRMNLIDGMNDSLIIDGSYNASPDTLLAALEVLSEIRGRKIAALGTMNELGEHAKTEHRRIGKYVPKVASILVAVGEHGHYYAQAAREYGMSAEYIHIFNTAQEAGAFLRTIVRKNDVILAKGSQNNVRMEILVKMLMKDPQRARELLVRQDEYWTTHA